MLNEKVSTFLLETSLSVSLTLLLLESPEIWQNTWGHTGWCSGQKLVLVSALSFDAWMALAKSFLSSVLTTSAKILEWVIGTPFSIPLHRAVGWWISKGLSTRLQNILQITPILEEHSKPGYPNVARLLNILTSDRVSNIKAMEIIMPILKTNQFTPFTH